MVPPSYKGGGGDAGFLFYLVAKQAVEFPQVYQLMVNIHIDTVLSSSKGISIFHPCDLTIKPVIAIPMPEK